MVQKLQQNNSIIINKQLSNWHSNIIGFNNFMDRILWAIHLKWGGGHAENKLLSQDNSISAI